MPGLWWDDYSEDPNETVNSTAWDLPGYATKAYRGTKKPRKSLLSRKKARKNST